MVIDTQKTEITTNTSSDIVSFQIEANAVAFETLTATLYKNPIKAIVRELATNAYDAQVDNGNKERPFKVNVPTKINPVFSIRDYGTGLSHEDMMQVYTTIFKSTRRNSNESIGGLGLGSKTPFSYGTSFNVTSYVDGVKRVYGAFKVDGNPSITLQGTFDTDEENGLLVTVPVRKEDVYTWENEAIRVYQYFNVPPVCNINIPEAFQEDELLVEGDTYKVFKTGRYNKMEIKVIMGQVEYDVDVRAISSKIPKLDGVYGFNLVLYADIGSLKPQVSREALYIDDNLITFIDKTFNNLVDTYVSNLQARIDTDECLWDASKRAYEAFSDGIGDLMNTSDVKVTYKGTTLDITNKTYVSTTDTVNVRVNIQKERGFRNCYLKSHDNIVVVADSTSGFKAYVDGQRSAGKSVILLSKQTGVKMQEFKDNVAEVLDTLGNPPAIYLSSFDVGRPRTVRKRSGNKTPKGNIKGSTWKITTNYSGEEYFGQTSTIYTSNDVNVPVIYIPSIGSRIAKSFTSAPMCDITKCPTPLLYILSKYGNISSDTIVVRVGKSQKHLIPKNWENIFDVLAKIKVPKKHLLPAPFLHYRFNNMKRYAVTNSKYKDLTKYIEFIEKQDEVFDNSLYHSGALSVYNLTATNEPVVPKKLTKDWAAERFPLLLTSVSWVDSSNFEMLYEANELLVEKRKSDNNLQLLVA